MSIELKGKLIEKLSPVRGEGRKGPWEKQEFVIETDDQYPRKICISVWNDKISLIEPLVPGDLLNVFVNIESREYNSRWYTDIRAWRVDREGEEGMAPSPPQDELPPDLENPEDDLPF